MTYNTNQWDRRLVPGDNTLPTSDAVRVDAVVPRLSSVAARSLSLRAKTSPRGASGSFPNSQTERMSIRFRADAPTSCATDSSLAPRRGCSCSSAAHPWPYASAASRDEYSFGFKWGTRRCCCAGLSAGSTASLSFGDFTRAARIRSDICHRQANVASHLSTCGIMTL